MEVQLDSYSEMYSVYLKHAACLLISKIMAIKARLSLSLIYTGQAQSNGKRQLKENVRTVETFHMQSSASTYKNAEVAVAPPQPWHNQKSYFLNPNATANPYCSPQRLRP
jgi:hypothetical protein